jgi:peptide/nickel transport system permease protein
MLSYLGQRLVQALVALFAIAILIFMVLHFDSATPARGMLGLRATQAQVNALNREFGWNLPVWVQFGRWFGRTFLSGQLWPLLVAFLPRTLELAGLGMGLAFLASIRLALWQMDNQNTWRDHLATGILYVLNSVPAFWLAPLLIWEFALNLLILPPAGMQSAFHPGLAEWALHMILPVLTVFCAAVGGWTRYLRAALDETMHTEFVRTARAKGADEARVLRRHSLKNSLLPTLTLAGSSFPILINTVIVVEIIFDIPGAGAAFYRNLNTLHFASATSLAFLLALVGVLGGVLSDMTYAWVDPRIQYR